MTPVVGQDGILRGGWQPPLSLYSAKLTKKAAVAEGVAIVAP